MVFPWPWSLVDFSSLNFSAKSSLHMPMLNKSCNYLAALACLVLLPCGVTHAEDALPLATQFQQLASQHQVCSAALAIIKSGQLQAQLFAQGCQDAVIPDADSIFQAASLGKPVFAYAVLTLAAQNRIDLDKPLLQYLPQGYLHAHRPHDINSPTDLVTDPRLEVVTARMVLQHRSGLPNWANGELELTANPGSRWQYSGEGFVLLQTVVESITGMSLDDFMRQQVFEPLGMKHSSYLPPSEWRPHMLPGSLQGKPLSLQKIRRAVSASTLHTSIQDYASFVMAVMKNEAVLKQTLDRPVVADQASAVRWGLGWGIGYTPAQDVLLWHWGNNYGYRAFVVFAPGSADGMVLLSNSNHGLALAEPLARRILPAPLPLFHFPLLDSGPPGLLCRILSIC